MRLSLLIKKLKVEVLMSSVFLLLPILILSVISMIVTNKLSLFVTALLFVYSIFILAFLPKTIIDKMSKIEENCVAPIGVLHDVISDFRQNKVFKKRLSQVTNVEEIDSVLVDIEAMASELTQFHQEIQDKSILESATARFNSEILKSNSVNEIYSLIYKVMKENMNSEMGSILLVEKESLHEYASWGNNAVNRKPFYSAPAMCPALRNGTNCTSNEVYSKDGCDHCYPVNNNRQSSLCHTFQKNGIPYLIAHLAHSKSYQFKSYHMDMVKKIEQSVNSRLKQIETTEDYQTKAYTDKLTGLKNKHFITETIDGYISNNQPFSIQVYDIDKFKSINDTFGHLVGDFVLKQLGQLLEAHVQKGKSFAGRYGGEEFLVVTIGDDFYEAVNHAELIRKAIESHTFRYSDELTIPVTSSIGVSFYPKDGNSFEAVFKRADDALYQAKQSGRNKVMFIQ